ncbi:hypothetical protein G6F32_016354 [Rhizopus arrhizus]|nr:hypothetical protein G6F32_016354 [Rhizopus arrhizus]
MSVYARGVAGSVASPGRTLAGRGVGSLAVAWPHGLLPFAAGGTMARKPGCPGSVVFTARSSRVAAAAVDALARPPAASPAEAIRRRRVGESRSAHCASSSPASMWVSAGESRSGCMNGSVAA